MLELARRSFPSAARTSALRARPQIARARSILDAIRSSLPESLDSLRAVARLGAAALEAGEGGRWSYAIDTLRALSSELTDAECEENCTLDPDAVVQKASSSEAHARSEPQPGSDPMECLASASSGPNRHRLTHLCEPRLIPHRPEIDPGWMGSTAPELFACWHVCATP